MIVLLLAAWFDCRQGRIPNFLIVTGTAAAFLCGATGPAGAVARILIVFAVLYPFYLCKGLGAGDVKLIMTAAAFLPAGELLWLCAAGFGSAAVAGVFYRVARKRRTPLRMACYLVFGAVCGLAVQVLLKGGFF